MLRKAGGVMRREYIKRNIKSNFIKALKQNDGASIGRYFKESAEFGDDFTQELIRLVESHKAAQVEAEGKAEEKRREGEREKEREGEELAREINQMRRELFKEEMKQYIRERRNLNDWLINSEFSSLTGGDIDEDGTPRRKNDEFVSLWNTALSEEVEAGNMKHEDEVLLTAIKVDKESRREVAPSITLYEKPHNPSSTPQKFEVKDFDPEDFMFGGGNKKRNKSKKKSKRRSKRYSKRKYKRHRSKKKKYTKKKR
tara:strand:- start:662 stop:1429 length:768 start_codon:yes stop_codon:yes gene_type:complete